MQKFFVIGSAGYIPEWYDKYAPGIHEKGYRLCAINNAWAIDPRNTEYWFHSTDYKDNGCSMPTPDQKAPMKEIVGVLTEPIWYDKQGWSGTMLLNTLCHMLNMTIKAKTILLFAGCDCIYEDKKEDHFYGKGTADPLRFGKEWLVGELTKLKKKAAEIGTEIYNVGMQEKTLLPFERKNPESVE